MSLTHARQLRAARALLDWRQSELAELSGVSLGNIKLMEKRPGRLNSKLSTLQALERAFDDAGLRFIPGGVVLDALVEPQSRGVFVSYDAPIGPAEAAFLQEALSRAGYAAPPSGSAESHEGEG